MFGYTPTEKKSQHVAVSVRTAIIMLVLHRRGQLFLYNAMRVNTINTWSYQKVV